jgi:hypothetical protein
MKKERPILFSGAMIRAIIDGRKSQTRRVMKPQPDYVCGHDNEEVWRGNKVIACPYGIPKDRFWCRETWAQDLEGEVFYAADHLSMPSTIEKWRPSIFMPRSISRITLEIVDIRVQRLQDISEEYAKAEGVENLGGLWRDYQLRTLDHFETARESFRSLWDSINKKRGYPFESNPWIYVISFKRIK